MDQIRLIDPGRLKKTLERFKYPALILLLGLALILWPSRSKQEPDAKLPDTEPVTQSIEEKMEEILSSIDGAGQVRVLLTKRSGDEIIYQTDEVLSKDDGGEDCTRTTVIARSSDGADAPVQRQTVYGAYQGALIVCTGADSPRVRLSLVNAVAGLTGLSADRITVIKMKQ